eukprot:TRINITY_DN569_c1_g2_i3.p1 TRINITY_DN569_c1_g2~~TRINITY_DN569_c1_g2_i3.p1  ORF type:complete len:437 (+),score=174.59 TRINITY_DN569_c1_g2_i3:89-1399(+)
MNQQGNAQMTGGLATANRGVGISSTGEDTSNHHQLFIGDLSNEVDDASLFQAFSAFGSCSEARVMWDKTTGRTKGYGFVCFREKDDADRAMAEMNGIQLGSKTIRVNWATRKTENSSSGSSQGGSNFGGGGYGGGGGGGGSGDLDTSSLQSVLAASGGDTNVDVYVGNVASNVQDSDLRALFSQYGEIVKVKAFQDKDFAFVEFKNHNDAAAAIVGLSGQQLSGKRLKCNWGQKKEKRNTMGGGFGGSPYGQMGGGGMMMGGYGGAMGYGQMGMGGMQMGAMGGGYGVDAFAGGMAYGQPQAMPYGQAQGMMMGGMGRNQQYNNKNQNQPRRNKSTGGGNKRKLSEAQASDQDGGEPEQLTTDPQEQQEQQEQQPSAKKAKTSDESQEESGESGESSESAQPQEEAQMEQETATEPTNEDATADETSTDAVQEEQE